MLEIVTSIVPIFLVIALGWIFRKKGFPGESFWDPAEKFIYFVLLPCLFFNVTSKANFDGGVIQVPIFMLAGIGILTVIMLLLRNWLHKDGPAFTSMYQGAIRFNSYVVLSAAASLYGQKGLAIVAITVSIAVPIINILCVSILSKYGSLSKGINWTNIVKRIATNPLVVSSLAGVIWNLGGGIMPKMLDEVIIILARAALPLGLLAVGAGLHIKTLKDAKAPVFITCILKLIILPLFAGLLAWLFTGSLLVLHMSILFAALPGATSSYILAKQMGGDTKLMSAIVVAETLLSALTIPLILMLVHWAWPII